MHHGSCNETGEGDSNSRNLYDARILSTIYNVLVDQEVAETELEDENRHRLWQEVGALFSQLELHQTQSFLMICLGFIVARLFCLTLVTSTKIKGVFCSCLLNILLICLFNQVLKFFLNQRSHFSVIVNKFRPESACEVHRIEVLSKVKCCIDSLRTGTMLSQLF